MRRRLLVSTSLIALAAVLVLGLPLAIVGATLLRERADMRLERRADAAALRLSRAHALGQPIRAVALTDLLPRGAAIQATTSSGVVTFGTMPTGAVTRQISGDDGGPMRVTLIAPASVRNDDVVTLWLVLLGVGLAAVIAAGLLALLQARRLATPLERLARRVERIGAVGFDGSPVAVHLPEIDQVQRAINDADRRIVELVERERQFTANASHQMRTPLTALRMRLEELQVLADTPASTTEAEAAMTQVDRLIATIEHLESMARSRDDHAPHTDVGSLVTTYASTSGWAEAYEKAGRPLSISAPTHRFGRAEPEALRQIVDVLLDNALRHGAGPTALEVRGGDRWVRVAVGDTGARPVDESAIFARGVGHGTGIGLSVARDLALRAGGDLRLAPGPTTTFEALIPAVEAPAEAAHGPLPDLGDR
ncbi:MAG: HAMP domain-containing sensor histidine kinase [Patulibacter minatonensis]